MRSEGGIDPAMNSCLVLRLGGRAGGGHTAANEKQLESGSCRLSIRSFIGNREDDGLCFVF